MTHVQPAGRERREKSNLVSLRGASVLQRLLTELAFVLLPRGMTPKRFAELARCAFVQVAADVSKRQNGRVNHSRVAAQTGLSRSDVKRLLSANVLGSVPAYQTPVTRVIVGWRTDRKFADKDGKPQALKISGPGNSFTSLVKKYVGDIPHRAVLDEMLRTGVVAEDKDIVQLQPTFPFEQRQDVGFLSTVLPALVDGIRIASSKRSTGASSCIYRLSFPVRSEVDLAIVRERCASSVKAMLDGLGQSLGEQVSLPKRKRNSAYSFTITVLLAQNRASNSHGIGTAQLEKRARHD